MIKAKGFSNQSTSEFRTNTMIKNTKTLFAFLLL
jgi:hypothetical protein